MTGVSPQELVVSAIRTEQQHASKIAKAEIKEGGAIIKGFYLAKASRGQEIVACTTIQPKYEETNVWR